MTEDVKEKMLSEMGKDNENWVKPEVMLVLKKKNISFNAYYNADKNTFGPLLEATIYTTNETPAIDNAEVVDFNEVVGIKA